MGAITSVPIIDVDSHVTEPADLWTSRMSPKHLDSAPRVVTDPASGRPRWKVGDHYSFFVTELNHAGWREFYPSAPLDFPEADPGGWDPKERLKRLDENGIRAQLLFPNVIAFHCYAFMALEPQAGLECARVYNDFQTEFASEDPSRLIPLTFLPFWDLDASMAEMLRCKEQGHKGINLGVDMQKFGLPPLREAHWEPLLAQAQDLELPINFHIGFALRTSTEMEQRMAESRADEVQWAANVATQFLGNASSIVEVIMGGICERFPKLDFVSVESGYGYIPFLLAALDWQWKGMACGNARPGWLLPSEYFRRQVYATFWFEEGIERQIDLYPDNVMFETDYPHPTSLSAGPGSHALSPQDTIAANLSGLTDEQLSKLLHDTAARVYHLDAR